MFEITSYPYPEKTVKDWSNGIGFGRKVEYTPEERELLDQEIASWREHFIHEINWAYSLKAYTPSFLFPYVNEATNKVVNYFKSKGFLQEKENWVILSAGAPGAGKSALLESIRERFPLIDPKAILNNRDEKWRPAAHYLALYWAAYCVSHKSSFYFAGAVHRPDVYNYFKDHGFKIKVIYLSAPDKGRNPDALRINDTFLKYADQIEFYYRTEGDAIHSATWRDKKLTISDRQNYDALVDLHVNWPL